MADLSLLRPDDKVDVGYSSLVQSATADGSDTVLMLIESSFTRGFAGLQLIGNTSEVCRDGKERAKAALEALGIHLPARRSLVSLTPAEVKKDGGQFDLPIAVSLALLLKGQSPRIDPARWLFAAELGLAGELRPVRGVMSFAAAAMAAGLSGLIVAPENAAEVQVLARLQPHGAEKLQALGFARLQDVLNWLYGSSVILSPGRPRPPAAKSFAPNFDDMVLHPMLERAALATAAGPHSLLLRGCPGSGKSMFAARLSSILPGMERKQHIEALRIYSACMERLPDALLAGQAPYRSPHHQASAAAVMGSPEAPGEMSLAHGGVLFLDELPEFRRDLLEALRVPLETGEIRVARSRRKVLWPARVILVAACNNCPCGWSGSTRKACTCSTPKLLAYRHRLSGPVLDRIDLHVNVPEGAESSSAVFLRLASSSQGSATSRMMAKVVAARSFATARNQKFGVTFNADLPPARLLAASGLEPEAFSKIVDREIPRSVSTRSVTRCLRVARTLADLDGSDSVRASDIAEAWRWQAEKAAEERGETLLN